MKTPPDKKNHSERSLSVFEKAMYGAGSGGFQLATDGVKNLAFPIFNMTLGLSGSSIGLVLMLSRLFDAFTDPLMGKISDNTRTRFGRRRPYIFVGSFLTAISFLFVWRVNPEWDGSTIFWFYLLMMLVFYLCSTIQVVPYHTLGLEMTPDYNERTTISGYKMMFSFAFLLFIPWVFRLVQLEMFEDRISGMRFISYFMALAIFVGGILPALFVKERYYKIASRQKKTSFWLSAKYTFQNRSFLYLTAIILTSAVGASTVNALGQYIVIYHMFEGDLVAGASMQAIISNTGAIGALLCIPLVTWLANRIGKIHAVKYLMILGTIGLGLKFFLYNQQYPWMAPFVYLFIAPHAAGFWTITNSMKADICDEDELKHGLRREGMFGSVGNWVMKVAFSLTYLISGLILDMTGFNIDLGGDQLPGTLFRMRVLYGLVPVCFMLVGLYFVHKYPLTRSKMESIRKELEERRDKV